MLSRQKQKQLLRSVPIVILLFLTAFAFPTLSQERPKPVSTVPAETAPTEIPPTVEVAPTEEPVSTDVPEIVPTNGTGRVTAVPGNGGEQPGIEATTEPTLEALPTNGSVRPPDGGTRPEDLETFCRLNISNGGDTNPYTFLFTATGSGIASYAWDFGDATNSNVQNPPLKTYATTGQRNISLTCTPTIGGSPLVLSGVVNVAAAVSASFYFPGGDEYTGVPPFANIQAVNTSSGVGLTYAWRISGSSNPADVGLYNFTTANISQSISSADFMAAGFGANGPAVLWYHLTVTDPASGLSATASRSVSFTPPAPRYTFDFTPTELEIGQSSTFLEANLGGGPLDANPALALVWTFPGGSPASATGPGPHNVTYSTAGVYAARLDYFGPGGGGSLEKSINVFNPLDPVDAGIEFYSMRTVGANIEVCFENASTGPIVQSSWNFIPAPLSPAMPIVNNNDPVVCVTYASGGSIVVELEVVDQEYIDNGGVIGQSSTATENQTLTFAPIADFSFTPNPVVIQGSNVNFTDDSDLTGGGPVTSWSWTVNGVPFASQSGAENPTGIPFNLIGDHIIRLTVTGPGGTSYVEKIVVVTRLEIGCSITGNPGSGIVLPTSGSETYTAAITSQLGRTITYAWTLTDSGGTIQTGTASSIAINWAAQGYGTFILKVIGTTLDGSICESTRTFTRAWQELDCQLGNTLPPTLYPTGVGYTFTANVNNRGTRPVVSYDWYLNGSLVQSSASNTYNYVTPNDSTITAALAQSVRYVVVVNNAPVTSPATSTCEDTHNFNVTPWPDLVCNAASMGGDFNPIPLDDMDGSAQTHQYTVSPTGIAGRPVTYAWTVVGGTITSGQNTPTVDVEWDSSIAVENGVAANGEISVVITVTNPDGVSNANDTCVSAHTIGGGNGVVIRYESLVCNVPIGDQFVVIGESANHIIDLVHLYGRPTTSLQWILEEDISGTWTVVSNTDTSGAFDSFIFTQPNTNYRLRYIISVGAANGIAGAGPCTSGWLPISTYGTGVGFECESATPFLLGNGSPVDPLINYVYYTDIDNSTGLNLAYIWSIIDRHGVETVLHNFSSTFNGNIYSTNNGTSAGTQVTLAQLGPIGPGSYTLRLRVSDPSATATNVCDLQRPLLVGFVDAAYTYTIATPGAWTNTALPVGRDICLTNTSVHAPAAPASPSAEAVVYNWTIGGTAAQNSLGQLTFTDENIPCFSFNTPGSYTVTVQITNAEGNMTDTYSLTFNVYGLQGITINRNPIDDFNTTQSFTSNGTNITNLAQNDWVFDRLTPTVNLGFATRNNQQNPNNVTGFTPGTYRATVSGTGPLGVTTASLEFEILASNELRARFSPSQWAGVAPMTVCYTDRSDSATPISLWEWDLDGDGTYETTGQNPGCFTYPNPGMIVQVRLRVTNSSFIRTATNTVRTYTNLEASQNFQIVPQGGMAFCFIPDLENSTLTGWGYGDGSSAGAINPACHTYAATGTYLVEMCFISVVGNTPGCITRPVTVTGNTDPAPSFSGNATCSTAGVATFNITNNGGTMSTPDTVRIFNQAGNVVYVAPLQLASGASTSFNISGHYGTLTLETTDVVLVVNTLCVEFTVTSVCVGNLPTFTVTMNPQGATNASQPYEIRDAANTLIASGSWSISNTANPATWTTAVPAGNNPYVSYTFTSTGAYGTYSETRQPCVPQPTIVINGVCRHNSLTGQAEVVFVVSATGADMVVPQNYSIVGGSVNVSGTFQLTTAQAPQEFLVDVTANPYASYTFSAPGFISVTPYTHQCGQPTLNAVGICRTVSNDGQVGFTITNGAQPMLEAQSYSITAVGAPTLTGTIFLGANGSMEILVPTSYNPYLAYTLTSTGFAGSLSVVNDCQNPVLTVVGSCFVATAGQGEVRFIITNNGGNMLEPQSYGITGGTAVNGTFILNAGQSFTAVVNTNDNPYGTYFFTSGGFAGVLTVDNFQCQRPALVVTAVCGSPLQLVITNTGGAMIEEEPYTVTAVVGGAVVATGNIPTSVNTTPFTITLSAGDNPHAAYNVSSDVVLGTITQAAPCDGPQLDVVGVCQDPRTFTVTNNGSDLLVDQTYTIERDGVVIVTGTLPTSINTTPLVITLPAGIDPYGTYTFVTDSPAVSVSVDHDCDYPVLTATSVCASPLVITITNAGGATLMSEAWEITDENGAVVASGTDTFLTPVDVTLTGLDPYATYTFSTTGFPDLYDVNNLTPCAEPALSVVYVCAATPSFTVTNNGGDMLVPQQLTVTGSASGTVINENIQLVAGAQQVYTVTGGAADTYTLATTGGFATEMTVTGDCDNPALSVVGVCGTPAGFVITNNGAAMPQSSGYRIVSSLNQTVLATGSFQLANAESVAVNVPDGIDVSDGVTFITDDFGLFATATVACDGIKVITFTGVNLPAAGIAASSCGRGCPVFKMYHTDEVGGWEIFRLDSANQETKTSIRENLSLGLDENVSNVSPSLSPDNNWIVFASDRDGNWEIYVAPTSGGNPDNVQRATFNTVAIDSDPVWGPNNWVVFETTRHGNWDLYALDMETGAEFRLTDSGGNDINPYWSPDGSKLVFQSDRPDENGSRKWQVYELSLNTLAVTKLSDGTSIDVDPEYSNNTGKIAFRSYKSEGANSQLSIMNADGSNRIAFSDEAGDATNASWSPNDTYIAYQSDLDGDLDIYVYEVATGETRHLTDNDIADYAPTWLCDDVRIVWTSDIVGDPNIFEVNVTPISDGPLDVEEIADQMTFELSNDIYPLSSPAEENASREGETVRGAFGEQTVFLQPNASLTPVDLSNEGITRPSWMAINSCAPGR